ncbi:major facilitator superfamily transporter [Lecanosticta acicola]|uniref:Major facilitator superfamily transporter n=1 Tax=Lecanosticta acicola TaxID=111012 RepID=A0AAI9EAW2_9PEZI|nr:major facilitator superfamily transporter [Lecanosticta acicola]
MSDELQKQPAKRTEVAEDVDEGEVVAWTREEERQLVRKLDFRIFPIIIVLFILNFIDRNNFANARLKGLEADLHLSDVDYQTCLSILLVGYVSMEIPSNMLLNKVSSPSLYLCAAVALWGLVSACLAAAQNSVGAIMARFFLGCCESVFFPGCLLFLSKWYTRREMQLRVTWMNAGNIAAQGFGGLIAAGILGGMEGDGGLRAWRWLFIIEGAVTITIALIAYPILPDWPSTTSWLSSKEKQIAEARLVKETGINASNPISALEGFKLAFTDPKVYLLALLYFLTIMGLSFSYFFPTITSALGYNTTETLLLTAPPWIFAIFTSIPNAWHADRTGERFFHYTWPAIACMVGYLISMATHNTGARYFSTFLMTTGYASGFLVLAWISNTIVEPPEKRAVAIAFINACGNVGSIPGSYIWRSMYGPWYRIPFGACFAILGAGVVVAAGLRWYLIRLNKELERVEGAGIAMEGAGKECDDVDDDERKGFRYLY